ncbi:cephamycin biosynthesis protein CmcJ [Diaporthe helianthi]|uniref:Cephamycin biosynthesis protein CmcJ n=1 Tax=Diaporthe helianthi TaxID=158607 RepID=A0A2P5HV41_DIAHE|nr:cephamycin biosynthesis protein CmcJ [Diaporthe helianthi]
MSPTYSNQVEAHITYCRNDLVPPLPPVVFGRGPANPPIQTPKQDYPVLITDVTGHEDEFNLQTQGIEFVHHESKLADEQFDDEKLVTETYYQEILDLTKKVLENNPKFPKISSLHILQHLRRNSPDKFPTGPVHGVHVDQHPGAVTGFARRWLGDTKADDLLRSHKRWQIINAWRAIRPVQRDPFAVVDARSVPDDDILKVRLVYPDHEIDILEVKAPLPDAGVGGHKWYFKDAMGPGDVVFFTQFDSTRSGDVPTRVPHTAFRDPRVDEGTAEARRSIEVRVAVFYDED